MRIKSLGNPRSTYNAVWGQTAKGAVTPYVAPSGMDASGGFISDYTHPDGNTYRCHIFTHSDEFIVSSVGNLPAVCDYVLVAGGGGGAGGGAGGGGGGGTRSATAMEGGNGVVVVRYAV